MSNYTPVGLSNATTYYWQVIANDSYNYIGIGSSVWSFTVDAAHVNNLPVAQINSPDKRTTFNINETIVFGGNGSDNEDGALSGLSLIWNSNLEGYIGIGETFTVTTLSEGTHYITLTAIDSEGAEGMDAIVIIIATGRLPDTGQIISYTDTQGEDSDYTINPSSYTKLDALGNDLDTDATNWVMVRDNVTGLIWEVKTIGDENDIHYNGNTYTFDYNYDFNTEFIPQLNNGKFGGCNDWRMPTAHELYTLLQNISGDLKINTVFFPNTKSSGYWASHSSPDHWGYGINFSSGYLSAIGETMRFSVRAVRGKLFKNSFVDNGDKTVTDTATGLMWQQVDADAMTMNWETALEYCEALEHADYDDWRLPNAKELLSIVNYDNCTRCDNGDINCYPCIDRSFFPNTMRSENYWSSTTNADDTNYAWNVSFSRGYVRSKVDKSNSMYVRAVRGGK